jgi:Flp pilus assembly protein TadG
MGAATRAKCEQSARSARRRRGTTVVEMAIILPLLILLLIGVLVGCLGVARYHQVAALAHESARWASVRGKNYSKVTGRPMATRDDIYTQVILKHAGGLEESRLSYDLQWGENQSTVRVTVSFQWLPEMFFKSTTFTRTAEVPVTF